MPKHLRHLTLTLHLGLLSGMAAAAAASAPFAAQLGPRPFFLVEDMQESPLKRELQALTHRERIELFKQLGVKMTPELKVPSVAMPFDGFTQEAYASKLIDEYVQARVPPADVYPQSFSQADILYWIEHAEPFSRQAVFLDEAAKRADLPDAAKLAAYRKQGIRIVAPPIYALLALDATQRIVPSTYAKDAKAAGLQIITWSLERSGWLAGPNKGFFYQGVEAALRREGDVLQVLDVLAREVGVIGVFSDWPATVTFYAACKGLK